MLASHTKLSDNTKQELRANGRDMIKLERRRTEMSEVIIPAVSTPMASPVGRPTSTLLIAVDTNLTISSFLASTMNLMAFQNLLANQCNVTVTVSENDAEGKVKVCITGGILETRLALNMFQDKVNKSV